jgi:hypothetical protein
MMIAEEMADFYNDDPMRSFTILTETPLRQGTYTLTIAGVSADFAVIPAQDFIEAEKVRRKAAREQLQAELDSNKEVLTMPIGNEIKALAQAEIDKLAPQIAELDRQLAEIPEFVEPENPLKNAEMAVEGNYNMIDGIINNGADQQEIAGVYDDVERADDERARTEMSAGMPKSISAEQAISELENNGKLNPEFYKSLPKEDRNVSQSFTMNSATSWVAACAFTISTSMVSAPPASNAQIMCAILMNND